MSTSRHPLKTGSGKNTPSAAWPAPLSARPPLALIAGPTASGKSAFAVELAQDIQRGGRGSVIINADSQQVYADLQVLSARPAADEMAGIPHQLFGTWDGAEACSAADWADAAKAEIAKAHSAGTVPILVGGTGLYMRTLLEGIAPIPEIDAEVRADVRALSTEEAYAQLKNEDPARAEVLNAGDSQRIARALEVVLSTGKTLGEWQSCKSGGIESDVTVHPLIITPPREELLQRCDTRFEQMLDHGGTEEVGRLIQRRLDPSLPVMRAIGVREIADMLEGKLVRDQAIALGQISTRQYAKRQYTWFRNQPPKEWPRREYNNYSDLNDFVSLLREMG